MSYIAQNEIEQFLFDDCQITDFKSDEKDIRFTLEALIVLEGNSQNSNYTKSYADTTILTLKDAKIESITLAGYKLYDANDNLLEEIPDKSVAKVEWNKCLTALKDMYLYRVYLVEKTEDGFVYDFETEQFSVEPVPDLREDSYIIRISFSESVFSWDKYLNRVQG